MIRQHKLMGSFCYAVRSSNATSDARILWDFMSVISEIYLKN
jgi:hypothetical protein